MPRKSGEAALMASVNGWESKVADPDISADDRATNPPDEADASIEMSKWRLLVSSVPIDSDVGKDPTGDCFLYSCLPSLLQTLALLSKRCLTVDVFHRTR
jgi:hypothetical protein